MILVNRWCLARLVVGFVVATGACATVGCQNDSSHRRRIRQIEPSVLAADWPEQTSNGYTILQKEKSVGRFPANLAVVRVTGGVPDHPDTSHGTTLVLDLLNDSDAVPWTGLFDNFPAISGVTVLGRPAVPFEELTLSDLIASARRQNLSLCLIYGQSDLPGGLVRMVGAVYDCGTGGLVATIEAQVEPVPGLPRPPDRVRQDNRHKDPECLTTARFQELVLRCIDDLVRNDTPGPTTQPNPWDRPGVFPMWSPWTPRELGW